MQIKAEILHTVHIGERKDKHTQRRRKGKEKRISEDTFQGLNNFMILLFFLLMFLLSVLMTFFSLRSMCHGVIKILQPEKG